MEEKEFKSVQDLIDAGDDLLQINDGELVLHNLSSLKGLENFKREEALKITMFVSTKSKLNDSLEYLKYLPNLQSLSLIECQLTSIAGVEVLKELTDLYLDGNPITNIDEILELPNLDWISIPRCVHLSKYKGLHPDSIKKRILVEKHLIVGDDLRGSASIMDTGLFDFKIK